MVYVDLPPESAGHQAPLVPSHPGREPLSPRRVWRRETVLRQLVNPTVVAESAELLEQQFVDIHAAFQPRNGWQDWLTSMIATLMLRINRAERIERKLRDWASYRAFDFWEDDQQLAVETIALKIAKEPARVVRKLRETPAGIDWLMTRWRALERVEPRDWTDEQHELAARLVGRDAVDPLTRDFIGSQLAELANHRARVEEADAIIRGLVEADLHDDGVPGLTRLRRYVRSLQRQMTWYVDQFHVEHPDRRDDLIRQSETASRDLLREPNRREANRSCTEPRPEPRSAETKPAEPVDEVPTEPVRENDETKPLESTALPAALAEAMWPTISAPVLVAQGFSGESESDARRQVRRRKAKRRRAALACLGGLRASGA